MKKNGFQFKMIFYQVLIIIVVMVVITGFFYRYFYITISQQSARDFDTIVSKSASQYESLLYEMDRTALQVAANPSIVKAFQKVEKQENGNYFEKEPAVAAETVKLLNSYNFKMDAFARICLYNNYEDFVCTAVRPTTVTGIHTFFRSEKYKTITEHFRQEGKYVLYMPPADDLLNDSGLNKRECFSVVREIKDYSSNSLQCGYVEVQEDIRKMDKLFCDIGDGGCVAVLDQNNKIVYRNPSLRENKDWQQAMDQLLSEAGAPSTDQLLSEAGGSSTDRLLSEAGGSFTEDWAEQLNSREKYVSYHRLETAPYAILAQKHGNAVLEPLNTFTFWLLAGTFFIILTAAFTEVLLVKNLSRPLSVLNKSIKNINLKELRIEIDDQNNDELQQLEKTFNSMLRQLKETMDKQYIAKTNELKSHLFALQSQMNPHFMYNILAIISMEAQADGNEKIMNICSKLCKILTFTSSMNDGFCTVEEEIRNAENYMVLMKERYEVLFEYDISIEEDLKKVRIPKLIVQPICENCFAHAFKNKEPIWKIGIRAYREQDNWFIEIRDNGSGFSESFFREFKHLKETVTLENVKDKLEEISIGGLCIPNIYMRLKICYGDSFICEFYNSSDGAAVLLGGGVLDIDV